MFDRSTSSCRGATREVSQVAPAQGGMMRDGTMMRWLIGDPRLVWRMRQPSQRRLSRPSSPGLGEQGAQIEQDDKPSTELGDAADIARVEI